MRCKWFCFPWQNSLVLEKGKISSCLTFPLFLSPCSQSLAALRKPEQGELSPGQLLAGGVTRLVSALTLVGLGQFFPVTLSLLPVFCHIPCSRTAVPLIPYQSLPPALVPQSQQEGEGLFSPVPPGFFPSSVHTWGNKGLPRVSG